MEKPVAGAHRRRPCRPRRNARPPTALVTPFAVSVQHHRRNGSDSRAALPDRNSPAACTLLASLRSVASERVSSGDLGQLLCATPRTSCRHTAQAGGAAHRVSCGAFLGQLAQRGHIFLLQPSNSRPRAAAKLPASSGISHVTDGDARFTHLGDSQRIAQQRRISDRPRPRIAVELGADLDRLGASRPGLPRVCSTLPHSTAASPLCG